MNKWPLPLPLLDDDDAIRPNDRSVGDEPGFGAVSTPRGRLPLEAIDVRARIDGLLAQIVVEQVFVNPTAEPVEATYIFPLPDRAAVNGFRMEVADRVIEGKLDERGQARATYDQAVATGHRAAIAEEERPGVFTLRVGNLMPGDRARIRLTLSGPLPYADGEVTFRFPLVVAPRYVPGIPLPGPSVGDGVAADTDAAPDASRISPPVLLPGFPNPVRLALAVDLHGPAADPAEARVRVSLHAAAVEAGPGVCRVTLLPEAGTPLDRDFILRYRLGGPDVRTSLSFHPDAEPRGTETGDGTFALTVIPPSGAADAPARPRDVAFVLDRSGSMEGWKIVAARRALARMVETLGPADRFAVLAFDDRIESPPGLGNALASATDHNRFLAVEFLATIAARGGTEMAQPLNLAAGLLSAGRQGEGAGGRDPVLVLVTDGQVANESQILQGLKPLLAGARLFALGVDRAVNAGFLNRLADLGGGGGGGCELVESEERLDAVLESVHRRIASPILSGLRLEPAGWEVAPGTIVPDRPASLFPGAPLLLLGRYRGRPGRATLRAERASGGSWLEPVEPVVRENPAIASAWARGQVRTLEDRYVTDQHARDALEREIVETSLRFGVLSRFTAYVAVDTTEAVNPGGRVHTITQPVSMPSDWSEPAMLLSASIRLPAYAARPRRAGASGFLGNILSSHVAGYSSSSAPPPASAAPSGPPPDALEETLCDSVFSAPSAPSDLPEGLDRVEVLARGGMGTITRAFDRNRGREVVVHRVPKRGTGPRPWFASPPASGPLRHPWILAVLEVIDCADHWLIIREFVEGRDLRAFLQAQPKPKLTPRDAATIAFRAATAVAFGHARGLLHTDLAPGSLIVSSSTAGGPVVGDVHLIDKFAPPEAFDPDSLMGGVSSFIPPELVDGSARLDVRGNVHSLGVLLYHLLTGRPPFEGKTALEVLEAVRRGQPIPPRKLERAIPRGLEAVCLKAMARDPADRYPTPEALATALRPFADATGAPPDPDTREPRNRRAWFWK